MGPSVFPSEASAPGATADDTFEQHLRSVRLEALGERRWSGFWLMGWGVANALAGGAAAIAGRDDPYWVAAGVTTLSFGVINALLSIGLLDLRGRRRAAVRSGLRRDGGVEERSLAEIRNLEIAAQLRSGQIFALNTGLDVVYIGGGALLFAFGRRDDPAQRALMGGGLAMVIQGAFLLAFDIVHWVASNRRAARLRTL